MLNVNTLSVIKYHTSILINNWRLHLIRRMTSRTRAIGSFALIDLDFDIFAVARETLPCGLGQHVTPGNFNNSRPSRHCLRRRTRLTRFSEAHFSRGTRFSRCISVSMRKFPFNEWIPVDADIWRFPWLHPIMYARKTYQYKIAL